MGKRKNEATSLAAGDHTSVKIAKTNGHVDVKTPGTTIQIIAGTYDRILHGITAAISDITTEKSTVDFADSFLFNAHASAIRCLAISPAPENVDEESIYLATGGSDERVNIYSISTSPLAESKKIPVMPRIGNNKITENPGNRELGSIMQHSSNITALHFPTRSKLLSAAEDNTINISRTRDLSVVSTIKAPRPKVQGQPSGDTAPPGATPAGVNDFAIHPSMKLMISVGRGERCMRLWNLVTGKKAGVLNFDRSLLTAIKEGKYSSGEGRRIRWNATGTEFAISFERGIIIYGDDSRAKCVVLPQPLTKVHQMSYLDVGGNQEHLAISTEDGRILFYSTAQIESNENANATPGVLPTAQIQSSTIGNGGRIKDFKILRSNLESSSTLLFVVTAGSDGAVKVWQVDQSDLSTKADRSNVRQIGSLIGTYDTGNRITCLDAFIMLPPKDSEAFYSESEAFTETEDDVDEESSDSNSN